MMVFILGLLCLSVQLHCIVLYGWPLFLNMDIILFGQRYQEPSTQGQLFLYRIKSALWCGQECSVGAVASSVRLINMSQSLGAAFVKTKSQTGYLYLSHHWLLLLTTQFWKSGLRVSESTLVPNCSCTGVGRRESGKWIQAFSFTWYLLSANFRQLSMLLSVQPFQVIIWYA